jgi:enoyl-CoA hydratase/carnithine racemase
MSEGRVTYRREGAVGWVTFDRPRARNAMTWAMYDELAAICAGPAREAGLRAMVLRGAGGQAFIAGTDIGQFREFSTAAQGIEYERAMEERLAALEAVPAPTVAVVEGWCTGGGLAIAACCDLRLAGEDAKFGVPIARTLGNTLSLGNHARLVQGFGASRTKRMLMLGEMVGAAEALSCGFLSGVARAAELDGAVSAMVERLLGNAPLTIAATKQAVARVCAGETAETEDLIAMCYASQDFRRGVEAFLAKRKAEWRGD